MQLSKESRRLSALMVTRIFDYMLACILVGWVGWAGAQTPQAVDELAKVAEGAAASSTAVESIAPLQVEGITPIQVVASFPIATDLIQQVGGPMVQVHTMVKAGESMHHFEPRASDLHALRTADLLVLNGAGFEPWWSKLVASAGYQGPVLFLSEGLALRQVDHHHHDHNNSPSHRNEHKYGHELGGSQAVVDPHAWLRADYAQHYVAQIYAQLKALLPEQTHELLQQRYQHYDDQLAALHQELLQVFAPGQAACGAVVVPHDSLFYFQQAYGCLQFIPLEGASADAELSAYAFAHLVRRVQEQAVRAALPEYGLDERLLAQLAREAGLTLGAPLYTETFAVTGEPVADYLGLMRWNQRILQEVLLP